MSPPVTQEQLAQLVATLAELRVMINKRIDDLSSQLHEGVDKMIKRQDKTNGTLQEHSTELIRLENDLEETKADVIQVMEHGCAEKEKHVEAMNVINGKWKRSAVIGSSLVGTFLLGLFIQYFAQIMEWAAHVFLGKPSH